MCLVSTVHGEYQGWEGHYKGSDLSSRDSDSNSHYIFYIKEKTTFPYTMFAETSLVNVFRLPNLRAEKDLRNSCFSFIMTQMRF